MTSSSKPGGIALFLLGILLIVIAVIWGRTGYYSNQAPILFILAVGGLVLMYLGSRLNRDKNPTKSVNWKPAEAPATASEGSEFSATPVAAQLANVQSVVAPAVTEELVDEATRAMSHGTLHSWTLTDPAGRQHVVGSRALLGRAPAPIDGLPAVLIALEAEDGSVSKSHAMVRTDAAGLWITELGSTNGTAVLQPDGNETECQVGVEVPVPDGSVLELGTYQLRVARAMGGGVN